MITTASAEPSRSPAISVAGPRPPDRGAGTWFGRPVYPSLRAGGSAGTFSIAGVCTGPALVVSAARTKLVLREVISSDPTSRCAASGTVTLVPSSGRPRMSWVDADHPTSKASGVLTRA